MEIGFENGFGGMLQSHFCAWERSKEVTVRSKLDTKIAASGYSHAKWAKQRVGLRVGDEGKACWRMRENAVSGDHSCWKKKKKMYSKMEK